MKVQRPLKKPGGKDMQTYIAENIKNLRNSKNVTQEELADYLNISFQSVSKWERGENIPDIQTVAALANYFDVRTDELLGMERIRGEFFTNDFHNKEHELMKAKKYDELIELLQSARKVYPYNIGTQWSLAIALALRGQPGAREEATEMCRRILGDMKYEKIKTATRSTLFVLTKNDMSHDEALQKARRLTHIWDCREKITAELLNGDELEKYCNI
jgi:transcriptional regulator with XRE-family HTH domain